MQTARLSWRLPAGADVAWRCWDGDYVVFNPLSGNTHCLDIVTGEVLKAVMEGDGEASSIASRTAEFLDVEQDDKLSATVAEILERLEGAGLIEGVP